MPPSPAEDAPLSSKGIGFAVGAYAIWGITPIYWKALTEIPADEVLIPRVVWTAILLLLVARLTGRQSETWDTNRRGWAWTLVAALLLAGNWGVFIYAVQTNQVLATSLGYYINPLVSIVLGLMVVGERLNRTQSIAVGIAGVGVATMAFQAGSLPWISLVLAASFAFYGLIHKLAPQPPFAGLTREMLVLSPLALMGLAWLASQPTAMATETISTASMATAPTTVRTSLIDAPLQTHALLSLTGVITAAPLLLFHAATKRLPLIAVGMFQYIAPTLTLILAISVYGETFTRSHAMGFGCVWIGLSIFTLDSVRRARALARTI